MLMTWRTPRTGPISWNRTVTGWPGLLAVISVTAPSAVRIVRPPSLVRRSGMSTATRATAPRSSAGPAGSAGPAAAARTPSARASAPEARASRLAVASATTEGLSFDADVARSNGTPGPTPEPGAIAARDEEYRMNRAPPAARAPDGPTHTTIGTDEERMTRASR